MHQNRTNREHVYLCFASHRRRHMQKCYVRANYDISCAKHFETKWKIKKLFAAQRNSETNNLIINLHVLVVRLFRSDLFCVFLSSSSSVSTIVLHAVHHATWSRYIIHTWSNHDLRCAYEHPFVGMHAIHFLLFASHRTCAIHLYIFTRNQWVIDIFIGTKKSSVWAMDDSAAA